MKLKNYMMRISTDRGGQVPHTQSHNQIHTSSLQSLPIPPPLLDISPCCTPDGKNHQTRRCGSCLSDDGQRQEDCHEKKACDLLSGCSAGISQVFSSYHLFLPFIRLSHLLFLSFFTLLVYGMTWHDMMWYRLATAGGDCSVRLWSLPTLLSSLEDIIEKDSHLCSLTNHTKSVNIVRWSHCGKFLASGSDDTCVLIYHHTPGGVSTGSYGMQTKDALPNVELWSRCCSLHGKITYIYIYIYICMHLYLFMCYLIRIHLNTPPSMSTLRYLLRAYNGCTGFRFFSQRCAGISINWQPHLTMGHDYEATCYVSL